MTKIDITPAYHDVKPKGFYVYIHRRASNGVEFYVGKGSTNRAWHYSSHKARTDLWRRCALKNGVIVDIVQDGMTSDSAYLLEMWLIAKLTYDGIVLYNISEGGGGGLGLTPGNARPVICSNGMRFDTTGDAARWACVDKEIKGHERSNIYMCCVGKIKSAFGYAWWYEGSDPVEYIDPLKRRIDTRRKAIWCSNGMKFISTSDAAVWLKNNGWPNAMYVGVSAAANGRNKSAYGLAWWYDGDAPKEYVDKKTLVSVSLTETWRLKKENA